jgi:hypothetical protein
MRRFRFHLGTQVIVVLILGIALAALRQSNEIWDSGIFALTLGILLTSVLLAIHRTEKRRAFWLGFALFGTTYLGLSLVASIESRLITTKALAYIDSKLPRSMPMGIGLAYADLDSDGWVDLFVTNNSQPNAVYVNKGNGTFQDLSATVSLGYTGNGTLALNNSAGLGLLGTSASFMRIGHSLIALIVALIGGQLSRHLYEKNRRRVQGPDIPQVSTSSVGSGDR